MNSLYLDSVGWVQTLFTDIHANKTETNNQK